MAANINFEAIPQELKNLPNWLLWKYEQRDGKATKVPYSPWNRKADTTDSLTWSAYKTVQDTYNKGDYDGIGFVLTPPYVGVDCDHCLTEDGSITNQAKWVIDTIASYSEISPSGKGVKGIAKGQIPRGRKQNGFEMYGQARYFTITGKHYQDTPLTIEERPAEVLEIYNRLFGEKGHSAERAAESAATTLSDDEIISLASQAVNGDKFLRLMQGDISGYPSQSEADEALRFLLAFYTKDFNQIDRIFRQSKLFREDKWIVRDD
jgi:primase-polymerase (primpol)-like protein